MLLYQGCFPGIPGTGNPGKMAFFPGMESREIAPGFPGKFHTIKVRLLRGMNHINTFFTSSSLNIKLLHDHNFLFDIDVARNTFLDHGQRSGQGQSRNDAIMVILSTAPQCLCCYGPCGLIWSFDFRPQKYGKGSAVSVMLKWHFEFKKNRPNIFIAYHVVD